MKNQFIIWFIDQDFKTKCVTITTIGNAPDCHTILKKKGFKPKKIEKYRTFAIDEVL